MDKVFQTVQSDLIKFNGLGCVIISELDESEYDKEEVGNMFNIKLENGVEIQAFEDEIINKEVN